jgi:hypothetical protein
VANPNTPFGLRQLGVSGAASPTFAIGNGKAPYNSAAMYKGDPIMRRADGYLVPWTNGTAVSQLVGIFWGAKWVSNVLQRTTNNTFVPATTDTISNADYTVYYIPCVGSIAPLFVIQANGYATGTTPYSRAHVGYNADVVMGSGSIVGALGMSAASLSTIVTTATLPFRIEGMWSDFAPAGTPGTDNTSPYNLVVVRANIYQETGI